MAPNPIKACGKVREEPKVAVPERDTLAYNMAVDGITSTPEYIAMIDQQVAEGRLRDNLADAIRLAVADRVGSRQKYTFQQFSAALSGAVADLINDPGYKSSFDFAKADADSLVDSAVAIRRKYSNAEMPILNSGEEKQLRLFSAQMDEDGTGNLDIHLTREVSRAVGMIQEKALASLGVDLSKVSPLEAMGIERMDIEGGDEDEDPSAVHMDFDGLGAALEGTIPEVSLPDDIQPDPPCHCNGGCCGKDKQTKKGA